MAQVQLQVVRTDGDVEVAVHCSDAELQGKDAELQLVLRAEVKDKRPVHGEQVLHRESLTLTGAPHRIRIGGDRLRRLYSRDGEQLALKLLARLVVDDGILIDSKFEQGLDWPLAGPPRGTAGDPKLMDPKDAFSFFANVAVLPIRNKLTVFALMIVGGLVVLGNLALGWHDEWVPEAQTVFYDHTGDEGSESPIMKALVGSGGAGIGVWIAIMMQLRKYMRFQLKSHPAVRRDSRLRLADLVEGESRVPLENVVVRVVACNRECGAYKRGSGTSERTVSFKKAINAVLLFERRILQIPAHRPLSMYIDGEVDFRPMFDSLLPPLKVGDQHGIDVCWEVQFLHPRFVDHELDGDAASLRWEDFMAEPER